ncbi:MAG: tyrosine--tRNA ligase [Lachnospiraceae bacterium]|nr:tyrosine--tRNA ligase [Lachnospiraceae bacterium]
MTEETVKQEVRRQMRIILQGAAQVVSEEELAAKVERSIRTGTPLRIKLGLDPSAPDIHLGHAVVLRKIRQMQELGHQAIIIIGDFTGRIGDPTGKSKGRKALSDKEVLENAQTYQEQIFRVLDPEKTQVRYNGEWLELLTLEEVLRLAATTTVARMLERDDFQNRYSHNVPIGLHEFFYPLMQAYDSVAIEADLELGGTDQTFNILMGRALQKDKGMEPQVALFMPILEGLDGVEKMSKSLGNYIGVNEDAKVMFKKIMEVPDRLIVRYFELTTDILPEELDKIKELLADGCNPRDVKLTLARTVTALYHTPEETEAAEQFYQEAFSKKAIPQEIPVLQVVMEKENDIVTLPDVIRPLVNGGFIASGGEFRRLVTQGGVQKNGEKVNGVEEVVHTGDVLKIGKKKFVRIELV